MPLGIPLTHSADQLTEDSSFQVNVTKVRTQLISSELLLILFDAVPVN
jgi:hypothetical protein